MKTESKVGSRIAGDNNARFTTKKKQRKNIRHETDSSIEHWVYKPQNNKLHY